MHLLRSSIRQAFSLFHREIALLVVLGLCAGSAWVFVEVADEVVEGETQHIDERILLAMRAPDDPSDPLGPRWIEELARDFTALGGVGVLALLTLAVLGYLAMRKRRSAVLVVIAIGGGLMLSQLLKLGFDRPRPDLVPQGSLVYTSSFPSGHSMMAAVTYLTLASLLAAVHAGWRVKIYLLSLAIVLTVFVGISRVYLGVHWPTDVLAGWTAGAFWALLCWQVAKWLQRQGRIEPESSAFRRRLSSSRNIHL